MADFVGAPVSHFYAATPYLEQSVEYRVQNERNSFRSGMILNRDLFVCIIYMYTLGGHMATSTRFVLAIHVLTSLAITDGKPMRSEDLAFSVQTNATFIRSLLSRLQEAGLTTSQLGVGGGALLAKPPEEIRLLEVYRAVENGEVFALHRQGPNEACVVGRNIQAAIRPALNEATDALEGQLASTTIADVANEVARLGQFTIPWQGC